jgi:molybdopterin-guanine dinucleotide biosynthesis protein A
MSPQLKPDTGRVGVVLAGDRSIRFEGGRALATLAGTSLLGHAVATVTPVVDEVVVSCRDEQLGEVESVLDGSDDSVPDVAAVVGSAVDGGPVAGLSAALEETGRLTAVVVACDTPLIPSAFLGHLLDRLDGSTTAGVVTRFDGRRQPLPAAVNVRAAAGACSEVLAAGGQLDDVVAALSPVVIPERAVRASVGVDRLVDVDTRADLARAERVLARAAVRPGRRDESNEGAASRPNCR